MEKDIFLDEFINTYKSMVKLKDNLGTLYESIFDIVNFVEDLELRSPMNIHRSALNDLASPSIVASNSSPSQSLFNQKRGTHGGV